MTFSGLVSELAPKDLVQDARTAQISRAQSYNSTAPTSVSISGDISSQLHGGYSHALARSWQAERQLTKVINYCTAPKKVQVADRYFLSSPCSYILYLSPTNPTKRP